MDNSVLLDDHRITHAWALSILEGKPFKHSIREVKLLHDNISKEIESRGFTHNTLIELSRDEIHQLVAYRRTMKQPIDLALFDAFDEYMLVRRKLRFDYQHHCREKSGDMRFQLPDKKVFESYTLSIQKECELKKTLGKTQAVRKKDIYKNNYKTGKTDEGINK